MSGKHNAAEKQEHSHEQLAWMARTAPEANGEIVDRPSADGEFKLRERSIADRLTRLDTACALLQASAERIETKLDTLLQAIADEQADDEDGPGMDLHGNVIPARDTSVQTL